MSAAVALPPADRIPSRETPPPSFCPLPRSWPSYVRRLPFSRSSLLLLALFESHQTSLSRSLSPPLRRRPSRFASQSVDAATAACVGGVGEKKVRPRCVASFSLSLRVHCSIWRRFACFAKYPLHSSAVSSSTETCQVTANVRNILLGGNKLETTKKKKIACRMSYHFTRIQKGCVMNMGALRYYWDLSIGMLIRAER